MESQKKHLLHIILHCFKKDNSATDIANNGATSVRTIDLRSSKFII